jgi:hypothetical protein
VEEKARGGGGGTENSVQYDVNEVDALKFMGDAFFLLKLPSESVCRGSRVWITQIWLTYQLLSHALSS